MNKIFLMGRLTVNPETMKGKKVNFTTFTIAVDRKFSKENETDFFNCIAFEKTGEIIEQYVEKGNRILLEGHVQISRYEDKDKNVRFRTVIIVDNFDFIDGKKKEGNILKPQDELPF